MEQTLKEFPTNREIVTAFHQDEGLLLIAEDDTEYSFVPKAYATHQGVRELLGTCWEIHGNQFKNERVATLRINEMEETATLSFSK